MKITKYAIMFLAAAGVLSSCAKLDEARTYAPEDVVAPVLNALPSEMVITPENMGTPVDFTWSAADFGVRTQVNYSIEASYNGGSQLALFTGLTGTSTRQLYDALNAKLGLATEFGGLGLTAGEPGEVKFFVSATIGTGFPKYYSAPVTVTVTVTAAERTYPKIWVIGDYCGWNHANSQFLFSFPGDEVNYEGIVDFGGKAANGFKITGDANWDNGNWGLDGGAAAPEAEAASIQLINDGGSSDIKAYSKRFYRFAFNRSTLVLTRGISFDRLGVIGSATPTGWDGDTEMGFDAVKQRFFVDMTLVDGEIKFRQDNAWDISYGSSTAGKLDGSDNIAVSAGNYRIYANLNNPADMTYELNAADYGSGGEEPPTPTRADWYLHGQTVATPDWGETAFTGGGTDAYKLTGVEVNANSQFLYKTGDGNTWIGAAASLGGDPYVCTIGEGFMTSTDKVNAEITDAGTYDYWLLPKQNLAYVMVAGEKPGYVADSWGIVGNLTDWGGGVADFAMTQEGDYLVRKNLYIGADYEFKVRQGNDWNGSDLGSAAGGVVDINTGVAMGGNNIKIGVDGVYDIYFDRTDSMIYIMTAGTTPAR